MSRRERIPTELRIMAVLALSLTLLVKLGGNRQRQLARYFEAVFSEDWQRAIHANEEVFARRGIDLALLEEPPDGLTPKEVTEFKEAYRKAIMEGLLEMDDIDLQHVALGLLTDVIQQMKGHVHDTQGQLAIYREEAAQLIGVRTEGTDVYAA